MKRHIMRFSVAIVTFAFVSIGAYAQVGSYAIQGARIVTVSGAEIANGNVVVRNGFIEAVGATAKIPADARIIDGKGLVVYPGLIDTYTNLGLKTKPRVNRTAANQDTDDSNSNYPSSLRPERNAFDDLRKNSSTYKSHRDAGFTTALSVHSDGVFNGYSAVINLAGDRVSRMVVKPRFGEHVTFRTARFGTFPSSLMGTFAALRQMFLDAKRLENLKKEFAKDPLNYPRPEIDPSLEALIPVVNGEKPIVIEANTKREIIRSLDLAKEFELKLIISGGMESGEVADRIKAQNVPVLLSLNFPKRTAAEDKDADPESMRILRYRAAVPKNAGKLKAAGVKFAFQSDGAKRLKDVFTNAVSATKHGITKDDAIRAFTLDAAELLGIDAITGSIEVGKIANLVIASDDIFSEKAAVKHVFIDGKHFKIKKPTLPKIGAAMGTTASNAAGEKNVGGRWVVTVQTPGPAAEVTLDLVQNGSQISGTMKSENVPSVSISNGKVTDDGFTFDATIQFGGESITLTLNGTVSGDNVTGTALTDFGGFPFSGTRTPIQGGNE